MDSEFYLPDPQDPSRLCYILRDNAEFTPATVVKHFQNNSGLYDNYSMNNMDLVEKPQFPIVFNFSCAFLKSKKLVYMYLSQLMSTFTNYLKVHRSLDGYFIL